MIILHCTIGYLAGGSCLDVKDVINIECPINSFDDLKVKFPTTSAEQCDAAFIVGCVGAIDGMLVPIRAPSAKESGNVRADYSGHYSRYGINVHGVCDYQLRFIDLYEIFSSFVGWRQRDNAYTASEHLCDANKTVSCLCSFTQFCH